MFSFKLHKKGLKVAHINICSLRNKLIDITSILSQGNIHILLISETHLDSTFDSLAVSIHGYNVNRKDRNRYGGGVTIYIQDHIPVKIRRDLMSNEIRAILWPVHIPHLKPLLVDCCYRPPNTNPYLDKICDMIYKVDDLPNEMCLLGDLNINWNVTDCPLSLSHFTSIKAPW